MLLRADYFRVVVPVLLTQEFQSIFIQNWSCYLPHWKENLHLLQGGTDLFALSPRMDSLTASEATPLLPPSPPVHFACYEGTGSSHRTHFAFANTIMQRDIFWFVNVGNPLRKKKKSRSLLH